MTIVHPLRAALTVSRENEKRGEEQRGIERGREGIEEREREGEKILSPISHKEDIHTIQTKPHIEYQLSNHLLQPTLRHTSMYHSLCAN